MSIKSTVAFTAIALAITAILVGSHPATAAVLSQTDVWWPTDGVHVSGAQPFKAMLENHDVNTYAMYWQVDGGQLNTMPTNYTDYPHKEASVDLSGWTWKGSGPYSITFKAYDGSGSLIGQQSESIYVESSQSVQAVITSVPTSSATPTPVVTPSSTPDPHVRDMSLRSTPTPTPTATPVALVMAVSKVAAPVATPTPTPAPSTSANDPLANAKLYVNPYSDPANWVRSNQSSDPTDAALMQKLAAGAESEWFGDWNSNVYQDVKNTTDTITAQGDTPAYVIYDIPERDCGSYSAGGASSQAAYRSFIDSFVAGVNGRKAAVILEPDALANMDCLSQSDQNSRLQLLNYAATQISQHGMSVYMDAGHPGWQSVATMAQRLSAAGVSHAQGFSLNISNFFTTADNITYGTQLSQALGGKHFVIDTGRNGSGPTSDYQWCNPPGRSLGQLPTTHTGNPLVDAFLWVKGPGGSDGACGNGAPSAGIFWPSYALDLARRTSW